MPESECICEQGVARGTRQLQSKQLKSWVVWVQLLEWRVNTWAAASPLPLVFHLLFQRPLTVYLLHWKCMVPVLKLAEEMRD